MTAHITPWNAPLSICRSLAPALAAGNSAVVKPAEQAPLTALALATVFQERGWPAGTYNVVTGLGAEAGAALAAHPGIESLTFTGSVQTGQAVLQAAAEHITPVVCELGGKSPQIVFEYADLDLAAAEIAKGIYSNAGQYCDAGSRLLVHNSVHEQLLDRRGPGGDRAGRSRLAVGGRHRAARNHRHAAVLRLGAPRAAIAGGTGDRSDSRRRKPAATPIHACGVGTHWLVDDR